ncbi:UNVERIFIED_CONTAM: hypothetical protein GTU68_012566 [Idotea baltica]|nr:hypothetical protein [Idotea baltica]
MESGTLYVIATPIGNLEDLTLRALRILKEVPVLACEDTRVTSFLLQRHEIPRPGNVFSYHEHNEENAAKRILECLENGQDVALCSDAGTPGISDPGYRAISKVVDAGLNMEVIPGPNATTTALLLSGLPSSSFTFKGFPPRKSGQRQNFFRMDVDLPHTQIFYESKFRLLKSLKDMLVVYGDRKCAVCLEMTKKFEKVYRGFLTEVIAKVESVTVKGEICVVVAGNNPKFLNKPEEDEEE